MPSIWELVIVLLLTVAIGIASRYFGRSGPGGGKSDAAAAKKSDGGDEIKKLTKDPESGVYVLEPDDKKDV